MLTREGHSVKKAFFLGIGGIGMSAIARYFNSMGIEVWGYDKTATPLTDVLADEGIKAIYFQDQTDVLPPEIMNATATDTVVVYTPAVPTDSELFMYFQNSALPFMKRAEMLGLITENSKNLSVAGTHGKTTTSCLLAHLLFESDIPFSAFLGGIASNFNSNYVRFQSDNEPGSITVTEADEFDRSFLHLRPHMAGITSMDADHLDIYGEADAVKEGFVEFAKCISTDGKLFYQVEQEHALQNHSNIKTSYGIEQGEIQAQNVRIENGAFVFDYTGRIEMKGLRMGLPGIHNVENAVLAISMALEVGATEETIRPALSSFTGVKRRFEKIAEGNGKVYIDDYAHHPTEIRSTIASVRMLYPNKKITAVFQPHLFTRTRDFLNEFAAELSKLDELILLNIYPAREKPIEGVTSRALLDRVKCAAELLDDTALIERLKSKDIEVLLTLGAGDIDQMVGPIKSELQW